MSNIIRHHLLEIILWPMKNGSIVEIRNSRKYLKELGICNERMTIEMTRAEHASLHHKGQPKTEEHKSKISESNKGNKLSEEHKCKISITLTGHKQSTETKLKRSNSLKGKKYGTMSEEHKRKLSEINTGKHWRLENGKRKYYKPEDC